VKLKTNYKAMKTKNKVVLWMILGMITMTAQSYAQAPNRFDRDGDGMLSISELDVFLFHTQIKKVSKADTNKDGFLDNSEISSFRAEVTSKYGLGPYTFDQISKLFPAFKGFNVWGILIRESHEDITASSDITPISKVKAATLSYAYDYPSKSSTWMIKGSMMRPFFFAKEKKAFVPSVTFNRVISDDSTKEANSFVPRLGYHHFLGSSDVHIFRFLLNYGTDFSFESAQYGAELEYEPVLEKLPFGRYSVLIGQSNPALEIRIKVVAQLQGGYVEESGNKENLKDESSYFRAGGKGTLDLRFFERLELSAGYTYLHAFEGTPENSQQKIFSASYSLGDDGNIALKVEYQYGNVPITQEEVENLTIGFGVKF
jgi:hypothetical protein